jgi:predicted Zn-dependent protease
LQINPDFAPAANNLAWMITQETQPDLGEALRLALIAKQQLPDEVHIMDTMGMVHYKRKSFGLARNEFVQAVEQQPEVPVFRYHLAMALYGEDKKKEAINELQQALGQDQEFKERQEAEQLLKEWQQEQ